MDILLEMDDYYSSDEPTTADTTEEEYSSEEDNEYLPHESSQDNTQNTLHTTQEEDGDDEDDIQVISSDSEDDDIQPPNRRATNQLNQSSSQPLAARIPHMTAATASVNIASNEPQPSGSGSRRNSDEMQEVWDDEDEPLCKRVKCGSSQENKSDKLNTSTSDEGTTCPICFDVWTSSGDHRLVSLKCGHLFGKSCLVKWIAGLGRKARCPHCNSKATKNDIRAIYARSLKALDPDEKNHLHKRLEDMLAQCNHVEGERDTLKVKLYTLETENKNLKSELINYKQKIQQMSRSNQKQMIEQKSVPTALPNGKIALFILKTNCKLTKVDDCRPVMCSSRNFECIVVTQPSLNRLFPGFGVRKFNTYDLKPSDFIFIHKKPIKDICFKPNEMLLLSTSLDKTLKLTSLVNQKCVMAIELKHEGWSCCFHPSRPDTCFVGFKNGTIAEYDMRFCNQPAVRTFGDENYCPIISVQYIQPTDKQLPFGLLTTSLQRCSFYELNAAGALAKKEIVPIGGRFLPSHYDAESGYALVSCRPSNKHATVTHSVSTRTPVGFFNGFILCTAR